MNHLVTHVSHPTSDSVTLRFRKTGNLMAYEPGQHGNFGFIIDGVRHDRDYSFVTSPGIDDDVAITVRLTQSGIVSQYLNREAKPGMVAELHQVGGRFILPDDPTQPRNLIMFAAGSGITPLISMIRTALYNIQHTQVSLIYSNTAYDRIIFRNELAELTHQFGHRFQLFHVVSQSQSLPEGFSPFLSERLSRLTAKKLLRALMPQDATLPSELYVCGPQVYMQMIEESVASLNMAIPVHKEHFNTPFVQSEANLYDHLPERDILIRWKNGQYPIRVSSGQSILTAALNQGINLPHSCKEARCGVCRSVLIQGEVQMSQNYALTENEISQHQILLCHGFPMSDDVIIEQGTKQTIL